MGVEQPSQEFGVITLGDTEYDVVRSPPTYNIEILNPEGRKVAGMPKLTLPASVRIETIRGVRPDVSARVHEIQNLVVLWERVCGITSTTESMNRAMNNILPARVVLTKVRDANTRQMVEVIKGARILMDHEYNVDGTIYFRLGGK